MSRFFPIRIFISFSISFCRGKKIHRSTLKKAAGLETDEAQVDQLQEAAVAAVATAEAAQAEAAESQARLAAAEAAEAPAPAEASAP